MTTGYAVVKFTNMKAQILLNQRQPISENAFVEMVVWRVPAPISGSIHFFKYRLALVVNHCCVLRYDNETGKGDHKHMGEQEIPYAFTTPQALLNNFWNDVDNWRF